MLFAIGETFPLIGVIPKGEGTTLNYTADGSLFMAIKWSNISSKEKREVKNGVIQFRYIQEDDNILMLMKLGTLPPMEFPFDPTIYTKKGVEFKVRSNILSIYAIEHTNHKLVSMRAIGLHQNFLNNFCNIWEQNVKNKKFTNDYKYWLDKLFCSFTTNELWSKGIPIDWK
ncbi:MAG: hypothetical protein CW346_09770 [Bacillaceae bacterium]|nr:hypothetical protein [Bacillaceae bacterium]